jgi:alpha-tubulin suppressor-like RCC1 family protein
MLDRSEPKLISLFEGLGQVVQVAAGASYTFAVTDDGVVHSFGSCTNFCLGHGDQQNELLPRAIQSFRRRNIHIVRVSAGDEHAVALDSSGYVRFSLIPVRSIMRLVLLVHLAFF